MCILFIYRNPNAGDDSYKMIVASNRDEFYKRPAKPAHYWEKHSHCLGGTDNEPGREGGTWLALSTTGRVGIILNLTGETKSGKNAGKGRGGLIVDYITSEKSSKDYLNELHETNQNGQPYSPYNLVLLELHDATVRYLTSSPNSTGPLLCCDNILGFGNSLMEDPYAKVEAGKEEFKRIVTGVTVNERDRLIEDLRRLLKSKKRHLPDAELQRRSPNEYEALSSIFVDSEEVGYGTRTHSILLVDGENRITFVEETRMPDKTWKTQLFEDISK